MYNETTTSMNKSGYEFINLEYMEMMSDGDDSMKKIMLEMLITELPEELQKMTICVSASAWEEMCSVSHKMKSTLAFVGNDSMTAANREIESLSKSGDSNMTTISNHMDTLNNLCPSVVEELKKEMTKL